MPTYRADDLRQDAIRNVDEGHRLQEQHQTDATGCCRVAQGREDGLPTPDTEVPMVSRSLRLPVDLDEGLRVLAQTRGVGARTLMRQLIKAGLMELDETAVVPLADVRRALAALARRSAA